MIDATRYPLSWPVGWARTPASKRRAAQFSQVDVRTNAEGQTIRRSRFIGMPKAVERLSAELRRIGARDELLSTNVRLRLSGLPDGTSAEPSDVGVAVYFILKGQDRCLACDKWTRVADNIAAIANHIDALRRIDRYGVGTLDQAFAGYTALPARGQTWRSSLGFGPDERVNPDMIDHAFKTRARTAHPDTPGGSHDAMSALVAARDAAYKEAQS